MDKTRVIYDNTIDAKTVKKAERSKAKFIKKFGDDTEKKYYLKETENSVLGKVFDLSNLELAEQPMEFPKNAFIVGNIRMGFGHYRIAMAIASCAKALGYKPYWYDLTSFDTSTGGKMIIKQNQLYSLGSNLSQMSSLFNRFFWEPLNSEGFRKLTYNAIDQKNSELLVPLFANFPEDIPFVGTHVWPAQGAIHSGLKKVVNVIPDNWPMALHLSEGAMHTVQTSFAFLGYKKLNGMAKTQLKEMPEGSIAEVGHYIDHELVNNLVEDTQSRMERLEKQAPLRLLLPVGGAGAGKTIIKDFIIHLLPKLKRGEVQLFLNFGDHLKIWEYLKQQIPELTTLTREHHDNYSGLLQLVEDMEGYKEPIQGIYHKDIFQAVYSSNLLMRVTDLLVTKPSELAFYPIPKLFIKRVGGHEAYGAVHSSEIGDGTYECSTSETMNDMIDSILRCPDILMSMNKSILKQNSIKTYHGGYEVVKLATQV